MNMSQDKKQMDDIDQRYKWALKKIQDKDNMINRQKLEIRRLKEVVACMRDFDA